MFVDTRPLLVLSSAYGTSLLMVAYLPGLFLSISAIGGLKFSPNQAVAIARARESSLASACLPKRNIGDLGDNFFGPEALVC